MKMKTFKSYLMICLMGLALVACEGEDGEDGAVGPAGPAGSANIKSTNATTTNNDWSYDAQLDVYSAQFNWNELTQAVFDNGTVQVFWVSNGSNVALPFSVLDLEYNYSYNVGSILIEVSSPSLALNNPGGQEFKFVVIPPVN